MDTALKPAAAGVSVAGKLFPLLTQLQDAVKAQDPTTIHEVLATIAAAIGEDPELSARPALRDLITPRNTATQMPSIPQFRTAATSAKQRATYYKDVIARLTQEVNAPEGGRRRRRRTSRKPKRKTTRRR